MMIKKLSFVLFLPVFISVGCDSTEAKESQTDPDTRTDTDADADADDTGSPTSECTFTGYTPTSIEVEDGSDWFLNALNETGDGGLRVESWEDFDGPTEVGEYTLGGNNYADCGLCVMMYEDCEDGDGQPADICSKIYFATEGTLEIVTFDTSGTGGGPVEVTLTDVVFTEVTINPSAGYLSTEVEDGDTWCVDDTYSGNFRDWSGAGDPVPDFTGPDQNGEDYSLSNMLGTMGVIAFNAGDWCPPCVTVSETHQAVWEEMRVADPRYDVSFAELLISNDDGEIASQDDAAAWADRFGMTYPVLHGESVADYFTLHIGGYWVPNYWIVDPLGEIRAWVWGDDAEITETVQEHFEAFLAENPDWVRASEPD